MPLPRLSASPHKTARLPLGAALAPLLALTAACAPSAVTYRPLSALGPEAYEFANMRPSNLVPKSSPATFEKAFVSYCLNGGSYESTAAKLRRADYIAAPRSPAQGQTAFVVDDSRPMVLISQDGRYCGVLAMARSGQTARINRFLAARFPKATPVDDPAGQAEVMVQTNAAPAGMIAIKRLRQRGEGSRILLAFHRSE